MAANNTSSFHFIFSSSIPNLVENTINIHRIWPATSRNLWGQRSKIQKLFSMIREFPRQKNLTFCRHCGPVPLCWNLVPTVQWTNFLERGVFWSRFSPFLNLQFCTSISPTLNPQVPSGKKFWQLCPLCHKIPKFREKLIPCFSHANF